MAEFAEVIDGVVVNVIKIEQEVLDTGDFGDPENFVKTSYNTHGGVHSQGGTPLRRNFGEVGSTYDPVADEFIPKQPYPSWTLVRSDVGDWWTSPKPYPIHIEDRPFEWNEELQEWEDTKA